MKTKLKRKITLVLGGARSGKSSYATLLLERGSKHPLYLATAEALDPEMAARIHLHKSARDSKWDCIEEPLDMGKAFSKISSKTDGVLLDCITLWLCNVMLKEGNKAVPGRRRELIDCLVHANCNVVVVANEVGMGIVPENRLGRDFRDLAGWLNQDIARIADEVVFVTAGIPLVIKSAKRRN